MWNLEFTQDRGCGILSAQGMWNSPSTGIHHTSADVDAQEGSVLQPLAQRAATEVFISILFSQNQGSRGRSSCSIPLKALWFGRTFPTC